MIALDRLPRVLAWIRTIFCPHRSAMDLVAPDDRWTPLRRRVTYCPDCGLTVDAQATLRDGEWHSRIRESVRSPS